MLAQKVYIYQPTSSGGGKYTAQLYFVDPAVPAFINLGDYIKDTTGKEYEIISPSTIPFTEGGTATLQYITSDVAPTEDTDYNSECYTPDQVNLSPELRTAGSMSNPSLYSGPNYEYNVLAGWSSPAESAKAIVGDKVTDASGKEYEITYIDSTSRFGVPCRVREVERLGIMPTSGEATLYRATPNYGFFQGTEMADPARATIFNRDKQIIDRTLNTGGGGSSNGDWQLEYHTITSGEEIAKGFTIANTPLVPSEVMVIAVPGSSQVWSTDYTISGATFSWTGLGLDGVLREGHTLLLGYFS